MKATVGERIKEFLRELDISQRQFAENIGIPITTLNSIFTRGSQPSIVVINAIAYRYKTLNINWLLTGEGSMMKSMDAFFTELSINERISQICKHLCNDSIVDFAEKIGITIEVANDCFRNGFLVDRFVSDRILECFPEVNKDWLLTGKGEMLNRPKIESNVTPVPEGEYMMVEYADLRASAGRLGGADVSQLPETHRRLVPKEYAKGGFLVIRVDGDSMDDGSKRSLSDGDEVLVYEKVDNHLEDLPIKKTLFVITSRDGNVLKQIKEINKEEGYIVCHSFNPRYEDYKMHISDIYQIFIVCKVVQKQISLI